MADLSIVTATGAAARALRSVVFVNKDVGYFFYIDNAVDFVYKKTTDGGRTWGTAVTVQGTETMLSFDVWYDRWTPGDTGTKIHIWYVGTGADDIIYKNLDTQTDTLSGGATVFNGASATATSATPFVSGTKARSGYLFCIYDMDAGAETGFYRSTDGGTNWSSRTNPIEATRDVAILFPGNETDSNDIWMLYQDASADELTLKVHDDSANTNSESSAIGGALGLIENATDLTGQYGFSGSIRHSDGHLISAHFTEYDTGTADFRVFDINGTGSITELTAIATNKDDMYHPSVFIDQTNNDLYVAYIGKSDGLETLGTTASVYYARSTDDGTTWSVDNVYSATGSDWRQTWTPLMGERLMIMWMDISSSALMTNYADYSLVLSSSKRWQVKPYLPVPDNSTSLRRGLVFDAPLHEKGGTTVKDLVHNITGSFGATAPTWVNTPYGRALDFPTADGNHIVTFTTGGNVNTQTNVSIEVLFKISGVGAQTDRIIEKGSNTTPRWSVGITTAGKIRFTIGFATANNAWDVTDPLPVGQYIHAVLTNTTVGSTTQPNIWINGIKRSLTQSTTGSGTLNSDTTALNLGNIHTTFARAFDGEIVYARVWNKLLNQSEALQLYSDPWSIYKTPTVSLGKSPKSAAVTGTATASITEANVVTGGKTIIITLTNDTWIADITAVRQDIINGLDSAQGEGTGWNTVVQGGQSVGGVVRTSDTVVTITLDAFATYDITAQETITVTVPATAVTGSQAIVATPTFTVSVVGGIIQQFLTMLGVGG